MNMSWIALSLGVVLNALANVLIKAGVSRVGPASGGEFVSRALAQPLLYGGIVAFVLALGAYSFALSRLQLSVAYPVMTSLGLVIVAIASVALFGEMFSAKKMVGTALIVLGVILLSR